MVIRSMLLSLFFVSFAAPALADDSSSRVTPDADADTRALSRESPRFGAYGGAAYALFTRPSDWNAGASLGGELAYLFDGHQGLRLGYSYGVAVFGPQVNAFDLDYSFQANVRPWTHASFSFGGLVGPSLGVVDYDGNTPDVHATFGARVGAFADFNLWWLTVGADASYRVGLSNPYGFESYATFGLHAGVTFELAPKKRL